MKVVFLSLLSILIGSIQIAFAQTANRSVAGIPQVHINQQYAPAASNIGTTGYPQGPAFLPYPTVSTPASDAIARQNAWNAYNAQLHQIPTAGNPNRLAPHNGRVNNSDLTEAPASLRRNNFQFSDQEIRSVQQALRVRGMYPGQVDGILGPDTRRAIKTFQSQHKLPVTGQPDASLNALLGIL